MDVIKPKLCYMSTKYKGEDRKKNFWKHNFYSCKHNYQISSQGALILVLFKY